MHAYVAMEEEAPMGVCEIGLGGRVLEQQGGTRAVVGVRHAVPWPIRSLVPSQAATYIRGTLVSGPRVLSSSQEQRVHN